MKKLESGVLKCKSWGIEPFWVVFGKVIEPKFMVKENNRLYRDKKGLGYMLLPLINLSLRSHFDEIITKAWKLGLREHPAYFGLMVYKMNYMVVEETAKDLGDFYSESELMERIAIIVNSINYYSEKPFITRNNTNTHLICSVFNSPEYILSTQHKAFKLLAWALHLKRNEEVLQDKTLKHLNSFI